VRVEYRRFVPAETALLAEFLIGEDWPYLSGEGTADADRIREQVAAGQPRHAADVRQVRVRRFAARASLVRSAGSPVAGTLWEPGSGLGGLGGAFYSVAVGLPPGWIACGPA
jgi:hypothetical protein